MGVPTRIILRGMFGKPTLQWLKNNGTESNGRAEWTREWRRYGQWTAKLSPGVQTDDDYGSVSWDVNGMRLADLQQISYVYRMGATEVVAPNVAIHVYDPNDIDNRADISLSHSTVGLPVTSGWQKYDLTTAIDGCFYYGNNIPSTTGLTSSDGTSATIYTLAQFQADPVFSTYVIGKITIEYGYYSTGVLSPAHICKVEVIYEGKRVDLELVPSVEEQLALLKDEATDSIKTTSTWMFGEPTLTAQGHGKVDWQRGTAVLSTHQKGGAGWVARLYGGEQTAYDDAAQVFIPVNELPIGDLSSALWSYFLTNTETIGVNMVVWAHDPDDFDKRVEITMEPHTQMEVASGWNAHEHATTDSFTFGGEGVSGNTVCTTAYTAYTWAQFMTDPFFSRLTIYRISFDWGFWAEGHLEYAYLGDVSINGTIVLMKPSVEEQLEMVRDDQARALTTIPTWTFGAPTLRQSNAGQASWSRYQYQKGGTGWNAKLEGGAQSGDDWASMFVPVNEMPLPELNTILWSYLKADSDLSGVALEIWAHDPTDFSKRVEIGQTMDAPGTTAGWHSEELTTSDDEFKWWGENVTDADSSAPGTCTTTNTNYTWAEYQSDSVFSTWTIYRIEFVIGWIGSGTLLPAHLAEVVINGTAIPLGPKNGKSSVDAVHSRSIVGGAAGALDVVSNSASSGGTAWTWDMGASGYVTKAIITIATTSLTSRLALFLYTVTPTGEKDDNDPSDAPLAADIPYFVGVIDFPALVDRAAGGPSYTIATPSTVGNLPLAYKGPVLYGILVNLDAATLGNVVCSIHLFAEIMEDN